MVDKVQEDLIGEVQEDQTEVGLLEIQTGLTEEVQGLTDQTPADIVADDQVDLTEGDQAGLIEDAEQEMKK